MSDAFSEDLNIVSKARIYFGHQSVGNNILEGINKLDENNILNILEIDEINNLPESFIIHSKIGKNENPNSKCSAFESMIDSISNNIDFGFMKFCYIDINRNSDVKALFEYYKSTMDSLIIKYPQIKFIHITSPLRFSDKGIGIWLRELLGRPNNSKLDNVKRNEYNNLLKAYYPQELIFDLAQIESPYLNGKREYFEMNGEKYYSLIKEFTNDGGHLNELGSKVVASKLINFLAYVIEIN